MEVAAGTRTAITTVAADIAASNSDEVAVESNAATSSNTIIAIDASNTQDTNRSNHSDIVLLGLVLFAQQNKAVSNYDCGSNRE
jgi:hypothetical protein